MAGLRDDDGLGSTTDYNPQGISGKDWGKDGWTTDDLLRQAMFLGLLGADWGQTRTIVKNPKEYHENNPLMGEHPSMGKLNNAVLATMLGHTLLMNTLSPEWRKWAQNISIGAEGANVARNKYFVGLRTDF